MYNATHTSTPKIRCHWKTSTFHILWSVYYNTQLHVELDPATRQWNNPHYFLPLSTLFAYHNTHNSFMLDPGTGKLALLSPLSAHHIQHAHTTALLGCTRINVDPDTKENTSCFLYSLYAKKQKQKQKKPYDTPYF